MTAQVFPFDASAHLTVDALLPFYVNGTLSRAEQSFVQQHVDACARCQQEARALQDLFSGLAVEMADLDTTPLPSINPVPAFAGLESSLDERAPASNVWRRTPAWARWALAATLITIVTLSGILLTALGDGATYRTLGAANTASAGTTPIAVMFDSDITESELQRIVLSAGARISDGPTKAGVFVLDVANDNVDRGLRMLRSEHAVRLAEPLAVRSQR